MSGMVQMAQFTWLVILWLTLSAGAAMGSMLSELVLVFDRVTIRLFFSPVLNAFVYENRVRNETIQVFCAATLIGGLTWFARHWLSFWCPWLVSYRFVALILCFVISCGFMFLEEFGKSLFFNRPKDWLYWLIQAFMWIFCIIGVCSGMFVAGTVLISGKM